MTTMRPEEAYDELLQRSREAALLASCAELLGWDEHTYMPPAGAEHRGNQLALLAGLRHQRATDPRIGELLAAVEGSALVADADSAAAANVREIRRAFDRQTRLPRDLVEELARTTSLAQQEWAAARKASDFDRFRPWLEKVVTLKRRQAKALGGSDPYDALLDEFEPGAHAADLDRLFRALREELVPLVEAITAEEEPSDGLLRRSYPVDRQRVFTEAVAAAVGFDFAGGRVDLTVHPFCTGIGPGDCRITARYREDDFTEGLYTVLHEVGHGLYEQGLDAAHYGTPVGEAASLGVHESQSRLWENAVGRGRAFWKHFLPLARQIFPQCLADVSVDDVYRAVNRVRRSFIRVQADEVTYNLHIIVRFELERAMIGGTLRTSDVPGAWNEAYRKYLGISPSTDAEGCLQDVHWSAGLFGYFPTYTLGNLIAAQLYGRADKELGGLDQAFERGEFAGLRGWLREKIHRPGRRYEPARLVERVTGAPPGHRALIQNLESRYRALYRL